MKGYMSGMILEEPDLSAPMREWLVWRLELKQMDQNDLSVRFAVGSALRLLRQRAIAVITTGGTIGALPYPDPSRPPAQATMPEVRNFVEEAVAEDPRVILLRMQPCDSNAIDETYRLLIRVSINAIPSRAAVVTHGTDTILETADWLYARRAELEKPVILVGAMTPLANGPTSDGHANLATALEWANTVTEGIHIVLSDWVDGVWTPVIYAHEPGLREKLKEGDGRYFRLVPKS